MRWPGEAARALRGRVFCHLPGGRHPISALILACLRWGMRRLHPAGPSARPR